MSEKKIIAVFGATGAQGGGLVRSILEDKNSEFTVRALTRDINSDKAKALAELGAEVVQVDIDNYDSIKSAFNGCYGAYAVTFFWEHFSPEKEKEEAHSIALAAKEQGLEHVIWSTLEDTRNYIPLDDDRMPTLMEKYKVPHFDAKGESNHEFTDAGVPTTFLLTSFYWDNLIHFGMGPQKGEDGNYSFPLPMGDKKMPGIAAEDIGKCAYGVFKAGNKFKNRTIGIAGEHLTGNQMAEELSGSLHLGVNYYPVPFETYRGLGFPGADDLGNMFQFKHDFESDFCGARDIELSRELNPTLKTFHEWLEENGGKIPLE